MAYMKKRTARIIEQMVIHEQAGGVPQVESARKHNITRQTVANILKRNPEAYANACREVANLAQDLSKKVLMELSRRNLKEVETERLAGLSKDLSQTSQVAAGKESQHVAFNVNLDIPATVQDLKDFVLRGTPIDANIINNTDNNNQSDKDNI